MSEKVDISKSRWGLVALGIGAGIIAAIQVGKVPPVLPILRDELGISLTTAGWVASIFNLCGATLGIGFGILAGRVGPVQSIVLSLMVLGAGSIVGGMTGGPYAGQLLLLSRFVEGVGFLGCVIGVPSVIVAATLPKDRSLALGFWGAYLPTGVAIGLLAAPWILDAAGWQGFWQLNGVVALAYGALIWICFSKRAWPGRPDKRPSVSAARVFDTLKMPVPWLFALCFVLYASIYFAVTTWIPTFFIDMQGRSLDDAAVIAAIVVIANIFGNIVAAAAMHRGIRRWVMLMVSFLVLGGGAWFLFADAAPDIARVPVAVAMIFFGGMLPAACLAGAAQQARTPDEVGTCNGIVVQGANLGALIGAPALAAVVVALGGWGQAFWAVILFSLAGIIATLVVRRFDNRKSG